MRPAEAALPSEVAVHLYQAYPDLTVLTLQGPLRVTRPFSQTLPAGVYSLSVQGRQLRLALGRGRRVLWQGNTIALGTSPSAPLRLRATGAAPRLYPGSVAVSINAQGRLDAVNRVSAFDYARITVASETLPGWPVEALKAQAVLTQTGLARYRPGELLPDTTQREAYLGLTHRRPEVDAAVRAVWGQVLTSEGRPVEPLYHAACGGHTSGGGYFRNARGPAYLKGVPCRYCRNAPLSQVTRRRVDGRAFHQVFGSGLPRVLRHDMAGRPLLLRLADGRTITGYAFWLKFGQRFGWDKAPGTRYSLRQADARWVEVASTGGGHGVGLCQWGAASMARQGKNYRDILRYYYTGTTLRRG